MTGDPHRFDDLFCDYGPIRLRRFFSGEAIWDGPAMIALVWDDTLYFTTDAASRSAFTAEGCKPFSYSRGKRVVDTSWFAIPDRLYDDPAELARWARAACDAALAKRRGQAAGKSTRAAPAGPAPASRRRRA